MNTLYDNETYLETFDGCSVYAPSSVSEEDKAAFGVWAESLVRTTKQWILENPAPGAANRPYIPRYDLKFSWHLLRDGVIVLDKGSSSIQANLEGDAYPPYGSQLSSRPPWYRIYTRGSRQRWYYKGERARGNSNLIQPLLKKIRVWATLTSSKPRV